MGSFSEHPFFLVLMLCSIFVRYHEDNRTQAGRTVSLLNSPLSGIDNFHQCNDFLTSAFNVFNSTYTGTWTTDTQSSTIRKHRLNHCFVDFKENLIVVSFYGRMFLKSCFSLIIGSDPGSIWDSHNLIICTCYLTTNIISSHVCNP